MSRPEGKCPASSVPLLRNRFCTRYIKWEICYIDWQTDYIARRIRYIPRQIGYIGRRNRIFWVVVSSRAWLVGNDSGFSRGLWSEEQRKQQERGWLLNLSHLKIEIWGAPKLSPFQSRINAKNLGNPTTHLSQAPQGTICSSRSFLQGSLACETYQTIDLRGRESDSRSRALRIGRPSELDFSSYSPYIR